MVDKTILHSNHVSLDAKMLDFHGWDMPLHYGSQLREHEAVRQDAGMFDVSHMTIVDILGEDARQFLRYLLANDVAKIKEIGGSLYTCMCNRRGGIIDDLIVYQTAPDRYRMVLNAATRSHDLAWIRESHGAYRVTISERNDLAMLAIQGPHAIAKTLDVLPAANSVAHLAVLGCVETDQYFIARTGYTGEDGLEIMAAPSTIVSLWQALLDNGVQPCGLAARDSLRIEAGLLLYGQDMDESTTPLVSHLGWTIAWQPDDRDFIGRSALLTQKQQGLPQKLIGLRLQEKAMLRSGQSVIIAGLTDGVVTSGTFSPFLNQSVGFARVPLATQEEVWVIIRNKRYRAQVGPLKFVQSRIAA